MARLREASSTYVVGNISKAPVTLISDNEEDDIPRTARRRPARQNTPRRYAVSDDSSAEESEQPTKLVQKQKNVTAKKPAQVRLANLSATDLLSGKPSDSDFGGSRRTRKARADVLLRHRPTAADIHVEPVAEVKETPAAEDPDDEDVEESIWCQSLDESEGNSNMDLPKSRKPIHFPMRTNDMTLETSGTTSKTDFTKQFQALSIFDADDSLVTKNPESKKIDLPSRPGSSSDKENNNAIIRFSPPRLKGPSKRQQVQRPTTPPPPASPTKGKLQSPSKKAARIPSQSLRPSLDAFWTAGTINDWNDQYSPQKPLKSPRKPKPHLSSSDSSPIASPSKLQSPAKRSKLELEQKRAFETNKIALAESFLAELDSTITQGQISVLSASTGGVQLIWSKTLNSTAGRANWRRETTKSCCPQTNTPLTTEKHFASIELATKVISDPARLLNVLAHEFCHLANFMVSGVKDQPHGRSFRAWGAQVSRAFGDRGVEVTTRHTYEIAYKYVWRCVAEAEGCGVEYKRHSKSIDPARHRCGACRAPLVQIKPVPRGKATPTPTTTTGAVDGQGTAADRTAAATPVITGYAAYVKEHFAAVKKSLPIGTAHRAVMEALGKKYRAEKMAGGGTGVDGLARELEGVKLDARVEVVELD